MIKFKTKIFLFSALIVITIFIIYKNIYNINYYLNINYYDNLKIDLVYTWVNGNEPEFIIEKQKYLKKLNVEQTPHLNDNCRYINNQELKYSLRSIKKNAPWINKIYIITNGQKPNWLDTKHSKIQIITHDQILPASALPTFNSEAIETGLDNIPNLSEHFLYSNDDCFINRPIKPSYFFTRNGQPIIRLRGTNLDNIAEEFCPQCRTTKNTFERIAQDYDIYLPFEPVHQIDPYTKTYFKECKNKYKSEFDKVAHLKFRNPNHFAQRNLIALYMIAEKKCKYLLKHESLYLEINSEEVLSNAIKKKKPILLCINDSATVKNSNRKTLKKFLEKLYPNKQPYEIE